MKEARASTGADSSRTDDGSQPGSEDYGQAHSNSNFRDTDDDFQSASRQDFAPQGSGSQDRSQYEDYNGNSGNWNDSGTRDAPIYGDGFSNGANFGRNDYNDTNGAYNGYDDYGQLDGMYNDNRSVGDGTAQARCQLSSDIVHSMCHSHAPIWLQMMSFCVNTTRLLRLRQTPDFISDGNLMGLVPSRRRRRKMII